MKYFTLIAALLISLNANAGMTVEDCRVLENGAKQIMTMRQAGQSKAAVMREANGNKLYEGVVEMAFTQFSIYDSADLKRRAADNFGYTVLRSCLKSAS